MLKQFVSVFLLVILFFHQANAQSYQRVSREQANNYLLKNNNYSIQNFSYDEIKKINPSFYIGFDYSNNKLEYGGDRVARFDFGLPGSGDVKNLFRDDFKDKSSSYAFILGSKFNNYLATEIFYQKSSDIKSSLDSDFMNINNSNLEYKAFGS